MPPFHDLYLYSMVKPPPWLTWIMRVPSSHFPAAICVPNSSRCQPESTFAHWHQVMGLLCSNHFHGFPSSLKQKPNSLACPMKSGVCSALLPSSSCLNSSCIACPLHPPTPASAVPSEHTRNTPWSVHLEHSTPARTELSLTFIRLVVSSIKQNQLVPLYSLAPDALKIPNMFSVICFLSYFILITQRFILIHFLIIYPHPCNHEILSFFSTRIWSFLFTVFPRLKKMLETQSALHQYWSSEWVYVWVKK